MTFVTVRARTDLGRTRAHNEDTFLVADLTARTTDLADKGPHEVGLRGSLFLVADGMGGAAAGELASSMAADLIFRHLSDGWSQEEEATPERFTWHLRKAVEAANERIHRYSTEHPDVRGMGTTATVVGVLGGSLYLAQVGDSRGYLVRQGVATQLTKDQSLMQRLVDAGELTEEEAAQSERRNIILQALGPDSRVRVDLTYQELRRGDILVICSDGLSGQVKREEIGELVNRYPDLDALCDQLITLANERGGPDNITAVVVRFDGDGVEPPDPESVVGYHVMPGTETPTDGVPALATPPPPPPEPGPPAAESVPLPRPGWTPTTIAAVGTGLFLAIALLLFLLLRD